MDQHVSDLAPGDHRSASFNWGDFQVSRISSTHSPLFDEVYTHLWKEFGPVGEMEQREVLNRRFHWDPSRITAGYSLCYEMIAVFKQTEFVAVRDHTIIVRVDSDRRWGEAVVHLSHSLIHPTFRRTGLAGWLRAWPIQTARSSLVAAGLPSSCPITLVAEMEAPDPVSPARIARMKSYRNAGFLMLDPSYVNYLQPDFRPPEQIDASGGPSPLPLRLVIRRVGQENERKITGGEVTRMVSALYTLFAATFRKKDMAPLWEQLQSSYPSESTSIPLLDPI